MLSNAFPLLPPKAGRENSCRWTWRLLLGECLKALESESKRSSVFGESSSPFFVIAELPSQPWSFSVRCRICVVLVKWSCVGRWAVLRETSLPTWSNSAHSGIRKLSVCHTIQPPYSARVLFTCWSGLCSIGQSFSFDFCFSASER